MAPQQPTARGIRIRNAHDAHLLFYAVVRIFFSHVAIPNPHTTQTSLNLSGILATLARDAVHGE